MGPETNEIQLGLLATSPQYPLAESMLPLKPLTLLVKNLSSLGEIISQRDTIKVPLNLSCNYHRITIHQWTSSRVFMLPTQSKCQ